jgi:hypothetical protein
MEQIIHAIKTEGLINSDILESVHESQIKLSI